MKLTPNLAKHQTQSQKAQLCVTRIFYKHVKELSKKCTHLLKERYSVPNYCEDNGHNIVNVNCLDTILTYPQHKEVEQYYRNE